MSEPISLKPGDVVTYGAEDCVVESRTDYSSPAVAWVEWELNPGAVERRVILAAIGEALYEARLAAIEGAPGDESIHSEGASFRLGRRGKADVRTTGASGAATFDRVEFWHYTGEAGRLLVIGRSHGSQRVLSLGPTTVAALQVYGA
jgi:hypothetical protein